MTTTRDRYIISNVQSEIKKRIIRYRKTFINQLKQKQSELLDTRWPDKMTSNANKMVIDYIKAPTFTNECLLKILIGYQTMCHVLNVGQNKQIINAIISIATKQHLISAPRKHALPNIGRMHDVRMHFLFGMYSLCCAIYD